MTSQSGYPGGRATSGLPYRGDFGAARPAGLDGLPLPPAPMPSHWGARPLKSWRYVGVYGPEIMLCAAVVRIGRARQAFWAVWDRAAEALYERTALGRGSVRLRTGHLAVEEASVFVDLGLAEGPGVEAVCPAGRAFAWTRKQAGVPVSGTVRLGGQVLTVAARAVIDDTAGFYPRHTSWCWSAGVGSSDAGRAVAWNLVAGVNDPPTSSERTVWVDGTPREVGPCRFDEELGAVDGLRFSAEAMRSRSDNLLLVRSRYRQPFGTFSGQLPGGIALADGYGVMEEHDVWW